MKKMTIVIFQSLQQKNPHMPKPIVLGQFEWWGDVELNANSAVLRGKNSNELLSAFLAHDTGRQIARAEGDKLCILLDELYNQKLFLEIVVEKPHAYFLSGTKGETCDIHAAHAIITSQNGWRGFGQEPALAEAILPQWSVRLDFNSDKTGGKQFKSLPGLNRYLHQGRWGSRFERLPGADKTSHVVLLKIDSHKFVMVS
jgi:hypothetical protein